jgi:K+-sensing histidine kinase KdpD
MQIRNSKKWSEYSTKQAWFGTAMIIFVAFAVRFVLNPVIAPYGVFHFFIVACLAVQYFYGYKFAAFSVALSIFLGEYYFIEPYGSFGPVLAKDYILSLNFALVTLTAVAFMEPLRRSLYASDLLLKVLNSRHKVSLYRENDRIFYAQQSNQAWSILQELLENFDDILLIKFGNSDYKIEPLFFRITANHDLLLSPQNWQAFVFADDLTLLERAFDRRQQKSVDPTAFDLRFIVVDGTVQTFRVRVDHFNFMDKTLCILRVMR